VVLKYAVNSLGGVDGIPRLTDDVGLSAGHFRSWCVRMDIASLAGKAFVNGWVFVQLAFDGWICRYSLLYIVLRVAQLLQMC